MSRKYTCLQALCVGTDISVPVSRLQSPPPAPESSCKCSSPRPVEHFRTALQHGERACRVPRRGPGRIATGTWARAGRFEVGQPTVARRAHLVCMYRSQIRLASGNDVILLSEPSPGSIDQWMGVTYPEPSVDTTRHDTHPRIAASRARRNRRVRDPYIRAVATDGASVAWPVTIALYLSTCPTRYTNSLIEDPTNQPANPTNQSNQSNSAQLGSSQRNQHQTRSKPRPHRNPTGRKTEKAQHEALSPRAKRFVPLDNHQTASMDGVTGSDSPSRRC